MGKIRTRMLGMEEVEKEQKDEQKKRAYEKKVEKRKEESSKKEEIKGEQPEKKVVKKEKTEKKVTQVKVRGVRYVDSRKLLEKGKQYSISEAVALLKRMKQAQFDESVELHVVVDEVGLKGEVELPHATGKKVRIRIMDDSVISELEAGKIEFDILVTHPSFMPKLAKFAKVLGPKGLMPNPKAGTISPKPEEVAKKFEKGMLRWKTEVKFPLIHQLIAKRSFEEKKIVENATAFLDAVGKPHIQKAVLKSTMSPGITLALE